MHQQSTNGVATTIQASASLVIKLCHNALST